jgi:hypothetical protein
MIRRDGDARSTKCLLDFDEARGRGPEANEAGVQIGTFGHFQRPNQRVVNPITVVSEGAAADGRQHYPVRPTACSVTKRSAQVSGRAWRVCIDLKVDTMKRNLYSRER